jgi:Tol biopolymer transport system component
VIDLQRGTSSRLTSDPGDDFYPILSPDGKQIAFGSNRDGSWGIYVKPADGGAAEQLIHKVEGTSAYIDSWSSEFLIYETVSPTTARDVWALPMTGDRKAFPVVNDKFIQQGARLSPDGHWLFYSSNESGRFEIYVQAFPKAGGIRQISIDGVSGSVGNWGKDGREIIFQALDEKMMVVDVKLGATIEAGIPSALFQVPGPIVGSRYAMSTDGQEFIIPLAPLSGGRPALTTVLNWTADIKK